MTCEKAPGQSQASSRAKQRNAGRTALQAPNVSKRLAEEDGNSQGGRGRAMQSPHAISRTCRDEATQLTWRGDVEKVGKHFGSGQTSGRHNYNLQSLV